MKVHRFGDDPTGVDTNPFAFFLKQGQMIRSIDVDISQAEDDDWLTFEFGERDPAISDFKADAGAHD